MTELITSVGAVVTGGVTWMTSVATAITGSPLLLFFTIASMVGVGVGLVGRITGRG